MKRIWITFLLLFLTLFCLQLALANPEVPADTSALEGVRSVKTGNSLHPTLEYYYYIPNTINKNTPISALVLVPGYNHDGRDIVLPEFKAFAKKENLLIIESVE